MRRSAGPRKQPPEKLHRFVSLRWKAFFHLSLLIVSLTAVFGFLNYWSLRQQFNKQLEVRFTAMEQEMRGLLKRSADRLQRLGSVVAMLAELKDAVPTAGSGSLSVQGQGRLAGLHLELDLQSIELFDGQGQLVWQWPTEAESPVAGLDPYVARVRKREAPTALLTCARECFLRALVPLLFEGGNAGVVGITQSIADLVLDFRAVTGTDIGIFVFGQEDPWPGRRVALTNQRQTEPFLGFLAARYVDPDKLGRGAFIEWGKSTYALHQIPLGDLIEAPPGRVILISDETEAFAGIHAATVDVLIRAGAIALAGELLLLILIRFPTKRLRRLAKTLPLLARGGYADARTLLARQRRQIHLYDEIDILDDTATTLSYHLESQANALAARNRELADERDFIRGLLNAAHVIILTQTQGGIVKTINDHGMQLFGFSPAEICGKSFLTLLHHEHTAEDFLEWMTEQPGQGEVRFQHEVEMLCRDGALRHIVWVHTRLRETHSSQIAVLSVGLDVTDRVRAEARLVWLANHDPLTGLFNRHRFQEELKRVLSEVERVQRICALLFFDLDHFKDINDSSGHAAGDALLKMLAGVLKERARRSDVVARLGGDEFAILMPDASLSGAETFARELNQRLLETPFHFRSRTYRISASIGIVMIPEHGSDVQDLMANADLAMYEAKQAGRGRFHVFSFEDQSREGAGKRIYWKDVITRALGNRQLLFHYQPIADVLSGKIIYHEALLRLRREDGVLIPPGAFMDAAQRCGLMPAIDRHVVGEALRVLAGMPAVGGPVLSINLSADALSDAYWTELLKSEIDAGRLDPRQLLFEVTETAAITDVTAARHLMDEMTELGFRFAIDDFGSGFASFHYLKHFPIAYVKIDRSFISKLTSDSRDRAFVTSITTLAHGHGQKVVAEGVEDAPTLQLLRELGVDYVQGFHIGRPGPKMVTAPPDWYPFDVVPEGEQRR